MRLPCRFFEVNIVVSCRGRHVAFDSGQSFVMIDGVHSVKRDASGNVNSEAKRRRQTRKGCLNGAMMKRTSLGCFRIYLEK